jgi:secreted Zn-dependent insulinase-like peptidase
MLREPLFNDLRTKQQLGYVVSSYYDLGLAITPDAETRNAPFATPIDYIVVNVLSQKVSPVEVANRIDEFMTGFRSRLESMPESEIRDHADALSTKLLKPIQKLGSEASSHFDKIRRYSPEILYGNGSAADIPWKSSTPLAASIKGLKRSDLLDTWDRVVMNNPSRIVSHVYGKKFPLQASIDKSEIKPSASGSVLNNLNDILAIRSTLKGYDNSSKLPEKRILSRLLSGLTPQRAFAGVAAVALIGVGMVGAMSLTRNRKK